MTVETIPLKENFNLRCNADLCMRSLQHLLVAYIVLPACTNVRLHLSSTPPRQPSPKLHSPNTPPILHMLQIQLLILLALRMEINPTNTAIHLIKTNVIKPLETRARDCFHAVVRHEEILFPAHENVLALLVVLQRERGRFGGFGQGAPGWEARPVLQVDFFRGAPRGVRGFEEVFGADDFAFEEGG
jgi:hypothetical protein